MSNLFSGFYANTGKIKFESIFVYIYNFLKKFISNQFSCKNSCLSKYDIFCDTKLKNEAIFTRVAAANPRPMRERTMGKWRSKYGLSGASTAFSATKVTIRVEPILNNFISNTISNTYTIFIFFPRSIFPQF